MYNGVEQNEGGEETWVDEGEVAEGIGAEGVAYSDDGEGHLGAELVDHVKEVTGMVTPCSW